MLDRSLIAVVLIAGLIAGSAVGGTPGVCTAHLEPQSGLQPGAIRFGVTAAGQVFTGLPERTPEDPALTMAALDELRGEAPFLVRLNRFFYRDGDDGIARFSALAARYTAVGYEVTLQLRYGPFGALTDPSPAGFAAWVRAVVATLGADPGVVAVEVTNEPNLTTAPDNSDGAHVGVIEALVRGVIAAAEERDARGYEHLSVGFNWFHDTGPVDETAFWTAVASEGGTAFAGALDWVGLNAYPGTYDFLPTPPTMEAREMRAALRKLRSCYLPMIGVGPSTPIRVIENGFPDGVRPEAVMADALEAMARAVHEAAATFNVTHYLWFTLRDTNSASVSFEANYGLLGDDYTPKLAFGRYRDLIAELTEA